jgi:hypothetical protein
MLLDTHPEICSPAEISLGLVCSSLFTAIDDTVGLSYRHEPTEQRRRRSLAETRRIVDGLLGKYCAVRQKPRWCEKSPANVEYLGILCSVFPDARYICLHRHCLDVVRSCLEFYGHTPPKQVLEYFDRHQGDPVAAWIERWCVYTSRLLALEADQPQSVMRVTYEQVVANPDAVLQPLLAFLGVDWVPGLAEHVFSTPHVLGRGDPKIAASAAVGADRVGKGWQLDLSGAPDTLLERMRTLLQTLGYVDQPRGHAPADETAPRVEVTSVAELFTEHFPRQLARHRHLIASAASAMGIVVGGPGGGAWTLRVDAAGARLEPGADRVPWSVALHSTDLLDAANRRLTLTQFRNRVHLTGDLALFDGPLSERTLWVLLGHDFRSRLDAV